MKTMSRRLIAGLLILMPARAASAQTAADVIDKLIRGDVVSRPAGTGVAHAISPGQEGITYLAYGTRETNDMCFYPRLGRVALRGLGIALRSPEIEHLPSL